VTNKAAQLLALAKERQATRWAGYNCTGDYHSGVYECDHVSPYTKTAGNVDADVMVMLQDWASDKELRRPIDEDARVLGYTRDFPTNRNLSNLLAATFGLGLKNVYATNLFPFIKPGSMSSAIRQSDLVRAAEKFAIPQIRIVSPRLVICLGVVTFNALEKASQRPVSARMSAAIANPFDIGSARVWCQAHTGILGTNNRNRGGVDRVSKDWLTMKLAAGL
jgi:restriction system protein